MMLSQLNETLAPLREELTAHYAAFDGAAEAAVRARMDAEPALPALAMKARLHEVMAEEAMPVAFHGTPFAFECGLRSPKSWGMESAGTWLRDTRYGLFVEDADAAARLKEHFDAGLGHYYHYVDFDHYNIGYDTVLERGLLGLIADAEVAQPADDDAYAFLDAVVRGLRAVLRLVERFADSYEAVNPAWAAALHRVPANPPATFFEALLTLSAVREIFASFEGVGISILGCLDRHLAPYYDADIAVGRLTEAEAAELIGRYLLLTDCRFDVRHFAWAETSTTMTLGGCDDDGRPFYHPLTRIILRAHRDLGLLNPKPQCRISASADETYLRQLAEIIASGDNVLTLFNDEVLIPAQQKAGKREEDCRRYVNGGCQELMLIGCEHSEGARWYFNLPRLLEVSLRPDILADYPAVFVAPVATESFEALYASVLANLRDVLTAISALGNGIGQAWPQVNPCPLISATLHDCLVTSRDLTAGGGRYNPTGLCYYGFATLADSLYAIQQAVFVQGLCTFDELRAALVADFAGYEKLLTALRKLPHYGQDYPEADAFAARLAHDIAALCAGLTNSRGGPIQPAIFSYWTYARAGRATGATPDGRHAGDYLSQGAAPSRLAKTPSTAHYLRSLSAIDWTDFPAIAVFDLQMPLVPPTPELEEQYVALLKTFVTLGGPTLQFTVTDPSTLRAAQEHPADYPNLVVRVAGYSAYFTALEKEVQDSIVTRTTVAMA